MLTTVLRREQISINSVSFFITSLEIFNGHVTVHRKRNDKACVKKPSNQYLHSMSFPTERDGLHHKRQSFNLQRKIIPGYFGKAMKPLHTLFAKKGIFQVQIDGVSKVKPVAGVSIKQFQVLCLEFGLKSLSISKCNFFF